MHLDGPRRDDEHLHTNISLLTDVVARQKDDWLQFAHNRLVDKKGFNLTENPHKKALLLFNFILRKRRENFMGFGGGGLGGKGAKELWPLWTATYRHQNNLTNTLDFSYPGLATQR